MVYFTCNHCGGSVKKPGVVKHYATKCRNLPIALTCMDCQKDFKLNEYNDHTSCISEAERYSGKDYVPKPGQNKGQKKQDTWMDTIRSLSTDEKHKMEPKIRTVFGRLVSFDNIPRKKAKFENFVTNSFKIPKPIAMKVWQVLEIALAEIKNAKKPEENGQDANITKENGHDANNENEQKSDEKTDIKKKKKKLSETEQAGNDNEENESAKKNKKKSKRKGESVENSNENQEEENSVPNKKKKKKDKAENMIVDESENHETQAKENGVEKKKSKKNKHENTNGHTIDNNNDKENEINNMANKKKKKNPETEGENGVNQEEVNEANQKFDWISIINECASDGMNVGKLKKKVIKKFLKTNPDIPGDKLDKKFQKNLKKSGIVIDSDIIKISS